MRLSDLFGRHGGNLMMALLALVAYYLLEFNGIFGLADLKGRNLAFTVCLIALLVICFLLDWVFQKLFVLGRIKISVTKNPLVKSVSCENLIGTMSYGCLDVKIPNGWVITDCYVTVEKITPVYFKDQIILDEKTAEWFSDNTKPEYRMLTWQNQLSEQQITKINIGEKSDKETFFVGQVTIGFLKDDYGNEFDFEGFEFSLIKSEKTLSRNDRLGLYEISLEFNWMRNGRRMTSIKKDGYIYASIKEGERKIRVGLGDYNKNKDIPKPLLKVEE